MIGKVPKQGRGFKGLINYLLEGDKRQRKKSSDRIAWLETRNLILEDPCHAAKIMRATAARSKRVKQPVYHYVISWHRDEAPSDDHMLQVADATTQDLGLEDYQALYIAHKDTEHRHVHIVVNRVHPETHKAWQTSHDYRKIETSLRRQSEAMGLDYVPGRHNDPEAFAQGQKIKRRPKHFQKTSGESVPKHIEAGLLPHRKDHFLLAYQLANNWDQLSTNLADLGFRLDRKGQGLMVCDNHDRLVTFEDKLSSLEKSTRLKDLEKRFGQSWQDYSATPPPPLSEEDADTYRHALATGLYKSGHIDETLFTTRRDAENFKKKTLTNLGSTGQETEDIKEVYLNLANANANLAYANIFHAMGLLSPGALRRAHAEMDTAVEEVENNEGLLDRLAQIGFREKEKPRDPSRRRNVDADRTR